MAFPRWAVETMRDGAFFATVFLNWLVVSLVVDAAAPNDLAARAGASVYISVFSVVANAWSFGRSVSFLGSPDPPPESIFGLFAEIVNLTQAWGALYTTARYWSLKDDHAHMARSLLHTTSTSIFEMGLVQAGVGWASEPPTTASERAVAWAAAYLGGVLATNMFLLSIVMGRRGFWERPAPTARYVRNAWSRPSGRAGGA